MANGKFVIGNVDLFPFSGSAAITGNLELSGNLLTSQQLTDPSSPPAGMAKIYYSGSALYAKFHPGDSGNLIVESGSSNLQIANATNNRIVTAVDSDNINAEANLTFDGSDLEITGTLNVSSNIFARGIPSGTIAGSGSYLALDTNNRVVVTSSLGSGGGAGGTIGAAEDGDYTDGLYTDFTTNTAIGVAIDRFNEVLKIVAPTPAPALSRISFPTVPAGVTAKLSFGSSQAITDYTSSGAGAGIAAVDIAESYGFTNTGNNFRLGVMDKTQDITGTLNFHVEDSVTNGNLAFSSGAFGNSETGTLKLELNGTVIHSVNLADLTGSGNPATGSGHSFTGDSGFINVSVTASSVDGNAATWNIFQYRTAKYKVDVNEQKVGWNYVRAIHTVGSTDYATNYIEWVNDPSGSTNDLSVSNARIEDVALVGSKYLSGVEYNTDATAKYKADLNNLYRNVYAASGTPISFTVTNSTSPSAQSVPDLSAGSSDNTKVLGVTASLDYNSTSLLSGAITCNTTVTHPLKDTISNQGSATTGNGFLIDNRSLDSSNLVENFHDETFRKTTGNYNNQSDVTNAAGVWNSQNHMTSSGATGHRDGLLLYNQRLYSPVDDDIPNNGNFASLDNVETGQPNYSGVTGTRTFYRVLTNSSGADKFDLKITSTKVGTTYNNSTLSTANAQFFAKIPGTTGWMDISQNFVYGSIDDDDGALISGASNDTDSGNNVHHVTFGTASVSNGQFVMIKILADESWQGYISQLQFQLGATTNTATQAPALDDIDSDNTGTAAKLSFGASNAVATYSNANGASISLSSFDSNDNYTVSGDRRGIFSSSPTITGTLNEDVSSNGKNYPANSFRNAYSGSLVLEVNGSEIHSVNIGSTLNAIANDFNGNGSGFSVNEVNFSTTTDDIPDYNKPYRFGDYKIVAADQRAGWNYARVIHRIGDTDSTTNYVEWIVDASGSSDNTAVTTPVLGNFDHLDKFYQSGIGYFASRPSASFAYMASNFYTNVYSNSSTAITYGTTTNCSISNIRIVGSGVTTFDSAVSQAGMPALNDSTDCELTAIHVTGTVRYDDLTSISGGLGLFTDRDVTVASTIIHPFKSNKTTDSASKTAFMYHSGAIGSTTEADQEYFNTEDFRIVSGNYTTQNSLTDSGNKWSPTTAMNNGGTHDDGAVTANGFMISPKQIGNAGDTRNVGNGGSLQAPSSNPNYSSLTEGTRTFYRYFFNNTVNDRSSITITLFGSGSLVKQATSLGANGNFYLEAKIPGKTGWLDVGTAYSSNNPTVDGAGALDGASPGNPAIDISNSGVSVVCNFNGESLLGGANDEKFALKVSVDEDWIGYLSRIGIAYS